MTNNLNAKIKLLIKSEKALLSIELRKKARKTLWIVLGVVALFSALILLNITLYLYFETMFNSLKSVGLLTTINILLAGIFFIIASKQEGDEEIKSIEEIRDFAYQQLSVDINEAKESVKELTHSAQHVKERLETFTNGDAFNISKLLPVITAIIEIVKKSR